MADRGPPDALSFSRCGHSRTVLTPLDRPTPLFCMSRILLPASFCNFAHFSNMQSHYHCSFYFHHPSYFLLDKLVIFLFMSSLLQVLRQEHWNKMRVKGSTNLYF